MEVKINSSKIILLLFPLIINKFDFQTGEKAAFFEVGKISKKDWKERNITPLTGEEMIKLIATDYSQGVGEFIAHNLNSKLVLVNIPRNEQQFTSLSIELAKVGKKINNIILLNVANYELIANMRENYLICPICEKIYPKEETVKENGKFICPQDSEQPFISEEIKKFSDYAIEYHLKNTELIIKKFLAENKMATS
ncbi:MAG: hypothetical protein I3273_07895, partial [Candidatus Moeniiplasma glomeromycotorum]|nr:hypothetical protein [Candidatus Moeniiplasma glomeromycotorum]